MKPADAPDARPTSTTLAEPVDRTEVVDAPYRSGAGQDLCDRALLESAFGVRHRRHLRAPREREPRARELPLSFRRRVRRATSPSGS
jgi:hypothetical protein